MIAILIKDAPIGTKLILGSYDNDDIVWRKVSASSDFAAESQFLYRQFDQIEINSSSRSRRNYGNNFFPQSNIAQWLNASGCGWFVPSHKFDIEPRYVRDEGFLSVFTNQEFKMIVDREVSVVVPLGSRKEFGRTYSYSCKVCLPSASELGFRDDQLASEGDPLPELIKLFSSENKREWVLTRTGIKDGGHVLSSNGLGYESICAYSNANVHPMIRLNGEATISDTVDNNGYHYIDTYNKEFMENFLNLISKS